MNHASPHGTNQYAHQAKGLGNLEANYVVLGRTGLTCSRVGFGTYRVDDSTLPHIHALELAIKSGCNLIDTSTNYTDGGSERCVGKALHGLIERGAIKRDQVIVISKVGYVQGGNLEKAQQREAKGAPIPEMVKYAEGCWHCLHPEFIEEQIRLSLSRSRLERLDGYLLHNPEYFLSDAKKNPSLPLAEVRDEFYRRIEKAFVALEGLVERGLISYYGVSSNTFGKPESHPEMTSLTRMWEIAEKIGKQHHFGLVQLPMNFFESGPLLTKNNGKGLSQSCLEFAQEKNLGVLVNRPLNAFSANQLIRLADFDEIAAPKMSVEDLAKQVRALEKQYTDTFAKDIRVETGSLEPVSFFQWGTELSRSEFDTATAEQWLEIENHMVRPQLSYLLDQLDTYFKNRKSAEWPDWRIRYGTAMEDLLVAIRHRCRLRSQRVSQRISEKIAPYLPPTWSKATLSQKAIACVAHTTGVHCVLNGMRQPNYVRDSVGILKMEAAKVPSNVYLVH